MRLRFEKRTGVLCFSLIIILLAFISCNKTAKSEEGNSQLLSSEPESYSATVVRLIEDGERREEIVSRIVVAPDKRREEWTENGERRVAILRFDTGKSYVLDMQHQLYSETDLNSNSPAEKKADGAKAATGAESDNATSNSKTPEWMMDDFREEPTNVETTTLPYETVAGEHCKVTERRSRFADGLVEVTKIFRAERLGGLMLKTESESLSPNHRVKITTERRNLKFDVPADEFTIPADFKKAQKLSP